MSEQQNVLKLPSPEPAVTWVIFASHLKLTFKLSPDIFPLDSPQNEQLISVSVLWK